MKQFNIGIVGYGWAAGAHIAALNAGSLGQVTAVCSSRKLSAQEVSARHGCPIRTCTDLAEMLTWPDLHVISICSFHRLHKQQILAAARAGKHLIIEKPLALSLGDLREVEQVIRETGAKVCVCLEVRFSAQFRTIRSLLDRGLFGKLHYGEVDYYHGIGPWYGGFSWYVKAPEGVSSLLLAGCHALDALLLCLGGEVEEVVSYSTRSGHATFAPFEFPSTTITLLKFKGGALGKVASVLDCFQPYYFHTHLVGSEGSLLDDKYHSNLEHGNDHGQWKPLPYKPVDSGDVADHPYQEQFNCFLEALARGKEMPLSGLTDAVRTHEVIFAADRSWKEQRPVKLEEVQPKGN